MTLRIPATALLFMALGISACGDDSASGGPSSLPVPVIDSATMVQFSGTANDLMAITLHQVYGGQHFATPNPFILPPLSATRDPSPALGTSSRLATLSAPLFPPTRLSAACAPIVTGVDTLGQAIDSDGDGIPDDFTADYGVGCSQLVGGLEYTFSGKYRLQDTGGGVLDFSYTTTQLSAMVRDTATGNFFRQMVTGTESADFAALHGVHQMDVTHLVSSRSGGDSGTVTLRSVESSSFDPDGGSTFQTGGTLPQGTLHFGAEVTYRDLTAGSDSIRFVLTTPTPIHLAFVCGTGIDGGQFQGLLEGDSRVGFRVTWTGCGASMFDMFGVVVE